MGFSYIGLQIYFCHLRKTGEKVVNKLEKVVNFFHFIPFFKEIGILFLFFQIHSIKSENLS